MNELFDKLIIRIILSAFLLLVFIIYRYGQLAFFKKVRRLALKPVYPSKNIAHAIHLFSRLLGIAIIFSEFSFYLSDGVSVSLIDFSINAFSTLLMYFITIYILESIILYNFSFEDEVHKRKNLSYSIISLSISISTAFIMKKIFILAGGSLINLSFLWLFACVLLGFTTKTFPIIFDKSLNKGIIQHNIPIAICYLGFLWAWTLIISGAMEQQVYSYPKYIALTLLKILLSLIIFPIFYHGISLIFGVKRHIWSKKVNEEIEPENSLDYSGIFEGILILLTALLTCLISGRIYFGTFYPVL